MCKKFQLLWDSPDPYRSLAPGPHWETSDPPVPASLYALNGNESLCISLQLCSITMSAARQTPGGPEARDTDSRLDDADKNFGPHLPLLFKTHKIWSVDSQENY